MWKYEKHEHYKRKLTTYLLKNCTTQKNKMHIIGYSKKNYQTKSSWKTQSQIKFYIRYNIKYQEILSYKQSTTQQLKHKINIS